MWIYGSGFPKSHNIGKAVDKIQGNEREVVGSDSRTAKDACWGKADPNSPNYDGSTYGVGEWDVTKGNSPWEGWGTALKPAHEPIVMARKPIEGSVAQNVLKHGVGGLNIDGCRVEYEDTQNPATNPKYRLEGGYKTPEKGQESKGAVSFSSSNNDINPSGRFPANIILDEEAGKILDEQSGVTKSNKRSDKYNKDYDNTNASVKYSPNQAMYSSNNTHADEGGASRFFYCPKISKKERNEGVEGKAKSTAFLSPDSRMDKDNYERVSPGMERFKTQPKVNFHPTVKPTDLMAYLIRLVTPKNGIVLDPFMGSGSTGKACAREGMRFVGIERDEEYMEIATQRVEHEYNKRKFF